MHNKYKFRGVYNHFIQNMFIKLFVILKCKGIHYNIPMEVNQCTTSWPVDNTPSHPSNNTLGIRTPCYLIFVRSCLPLLLLWQNTHTRSVSATLRTNLPNRVHPVCNICRIDDLASRGNETAPAQTERVMDKWKIE